MSGGEEEVQSIPGGGVGGAPPPGTGFASGTYPTLPHSATQISSFVPLDLNLVTFRTLMWRVCRAIRGVGEIRARGAGEPAGPVAGRPFACRLAGYRRPARSLCGAAWEARGSLSEQPGEGPAAHVPCRLARRALSLSRTRRRLRRGRRFRRRRPRQRRFRPTRCLHRGRGAARGRHCARTRSTRSARSSAPRTRRASSASSSTRRWPRRAELRTSTTTRTSSRGSASAPALWLGNEARRGRRSRAAP